MIVVFLAIGAPLIAAALGLLAGRASPRSAQTIAVGGALVAFAAAVGSMIANIVNGVADSAEYGIAPTGSIPITFSLRLDGLAATVAVVVTGVALAVQVYSVRYMERDSRYPSYAALISLFTSAMLVVVHADDLFVLLVGWEVMGICSYFLIGHHWERADARASGVKAFLVTRLGDVAFLFGIFTIGLGAGSFRIQDVNLIVGTPPFAGTTVTVGTLLLLAGAVGKSAQFPLHVWLPDAMAGPTPVSALIHAATMVAAGVFMIARLYPVFLAAPVTLAVLAVIAAVTMLGAALAALAQDDIKRVLAYSTVSQLAYMMAALAVGSYAAATFHLVTHGAFKALLFLAAGAIIHVAGSNSLAEMGGLRRFMPITFWCMTVGLAALAGLPPFAGFFSKDAVLATAEETARHGGPVAGWAAWLVLVVGLVTVVITAAYATRLYLMAFFGAPSGSVAPHEAPPLMRVPLIVLAVPSALLGFVGLRAGWLASWLGVDVLGLPPGGDSSGRVESPVELGPQLLTSLVSVACGLLGVTVMYLLWRRAPDRDPALALGRALPAVDAGLGGDVAYDRAVVRPVEALARGVVTADRSLLARGVRGAGQLAEWTSTAVRRVQNGDVQRYLMLLLAGAVIALVAAWTGVGR
jgi:NADH-quinone oxidoreductase subunit L